jgi:aspartyl-tRNA(Asn)/glutamyl-tRNA(Gln) amidotransferase subunit C
MAVEREQLLKMAKLARLHFTDEELQRMEKSLGQLVDYVDTLQKLDLQDVEPMLAVDTAPRPMRPDVVGKMLTKEEAFRNAPEVNLDHFSIPKVIGG